MNNTRSILQVIVLAALAFILTACNTTTPLADPLTLKLFNGADGTRLTWEEVLTAYDNSDVIVTGELSDLPNSNSLKATATFWKPVSSATNMDTSVLLANPHDLIMFNGTDGTPLTWEDVLTAFDNSDVVVVGELHGHPNGLNTAAALWREALENNPEAALSMEFFERDQQFAVNDYLTSVTTEAQFLKAAGRKGGNYPDGHRRMIEDAKGNGRPVYAANSPRRYNKLARSEGYTRLKELSQEQQRLFVIPDSLPEGRYKDDFFDIMRGMFDMNLHGEADDKVVTEDKDAEEDMDEGIDEDMDEGIDEDMDEDMDEGIDEDMDDDDDIDMDDNDNDMDDNDIDIDIDDDDEENHEDGKPELTEDQVETLMNIFRSQCLWDATMSDSILKAISSGYRPVVQVVGQFHVNFGGGIPNRLEELRPSLKVYTISVVDDWSDELLEDDKDKADCVIYVGPTPES